MARIPEELISEIRDRTDIVAVVGEHVDLRKAGREFKGLCPFHQEKTPSFHVIPDKRFFHCFGCQKHGNVFDFVMEMQGKSFVEAVHDLARRAGVAVPEREESPEERARRDEKSRLFDVNALAAAFYREHLAAEAGARGREYLAGRGIEGAVAETFQLGMAPDAWDGLARRLETRKVPPALGVTLGLVAPRRSGPGHYDKFRNRLMCPVILPGGEVVAFSGRTLAPPDPETPKYVNSSASPVYLKGHVLFGLHAARAAFRARGRALVVEGNFDVIALHQAGFAETVAPLGTALTDRQIETLRLLAPRVVLCLDGDKAGRNATLKDIGPLVTAGVDARVVGLPAGEDPDSFVRKHGAPALEELIQRAQPALGYFLHEVFGGSDRSADRRAQVVREVAPLLAKLDDGPKRDILVGELAQGLDVDARVVRRAMAGHEVSVGAPAAVSGPRAAGPVPSKELKIIAILADHPDLMALAEKEDVGSLLTDGRLRDMYSAARSGRSLWEVAPFKEVLSGEFKSLPHPSRALFEAIRMLRSERLEATVRQLQTQLNDAQRRGDATLARELSLRVLETRNKADALKRPEEKQV